MWLIKGLFSHLISRIFTRTRWWKTQTLQGGKKEYKPTTSRQCKKIRHLPMVLTTLQSLLMGNIFARFSVRKKSIVFFSSNKLELIICSLFQVFKIKAHSTTTLFVWPSVSFSHFSLVHLFQSDPLWCYLQWREGPIC